MLFRRLSRQRISLPSFARDTFHWPDRHLVGSVELPERHRVDDSDEFPDGHRLGSLVAEERASDAVHKSESRMEARKHSPFSESSCSEDVSARHHKTSVESLLLSKTCKHNRAQNTNGSGGMDTRVPSLRANHHMFIAKIATL